MKTAIKLKIADIVIAFQSKFPLSRPNKEGPTIPQRFHNFFYNGRRHPNIMILVNIVDKFPILAKAKDIFITYHPDDNKENWRLLKIGAGYIYKSPLQGKKQFMVIDASLTKVTAYLLPKENAEKAWTIDDIVYDFLQVLLICYFAKYKKGIFVHSVGIKDIDRRGLLFAGKSGAGKSTTARIWHGCSKALVLNDDRVIVRRNKGRFFIYGSPWHGDFKDYLMSHRESALLKKMFFIRHAQKNSAYRITPYSAFKSLYPAVFPTFWSKAWLENIISFSWELVNSVAVFKLGFVNDDKVINFVRNICEK